MSERRREKTKGYGTWLRTVKDGGVLTPEIAEKLKDGNGNGNKAPDNANCETIYPVVLRLVPLRTQ